MIRTVAPQVRQDAADVARAHRGFTLLELLVACVLIAIVLSVAVPNVRSLYNMDPLSLAARRVERIVERAQDRAIDTDQHVALTIDVAAGRLEIRPADPANGSAAARRRREAAHGITLAQEVAISSVWALSPGQDDGGREDGSAGRVVTAWINERGMIEPLAITIKNGERAVSIRFSPFVPVRIADGELLAASPGFVRIN